MSAVEMIKPSVTVLERQGIRRDLFKRGCLLEGREETPDRVPGYFFRENR